jgi:hypothetical protein
VQDFVLLQSQNEYPVQSCLRVFHIIHSGLDSGTGCVLPLLVNR